MRLLAAQGKALHVGVMNETSGSQGNSATANVTRSVMSRLLLVVAGAASALALPPTGFWWLLFVTVPVLLLRLEHLPNAAWRAAFLSGLGFGFGYFAVAFHWIGYAFFINAADVWMMPFAVGGLALFMASYWGVAAAVAVAVPRAILPRWLTAVLALAVAEWLRGHLLTGFPWAAVGLAADGMGAAAQLASVTGMTGLTLLLLLWAALPAVLWQNWRWQRHLPVMALAVLALLPLAELWGLWRLAQSPTVYAGTAVVRLVQPNISQDDKWRSDNAEAIFSILLGLSRADAQSAPVSHVIWPESSVPFLLDEDATALARIADLLKPGRTLVAGAIRREQPQQGVEPYYTSVMLVDDQGAVTGVYDKWRLVPGGEFLPMEGLLSRIGFRKVVSLPESFTAGKGPMSLPLPGIGKATMLVCYEVIFPHALVPPERPDVLVNVTNDGWFGRSTGPHQHLAQARMRSIEQGLPLFRAANTGISAVIDPAGRMLAHSALETRTVIDSRVPKSLPPTPYSRWGDWLLLALLAGFAAVLRRVRLSTREQASRAL